MSRQVIPPTRSPVSSPQQTINLLQKRLYSAEEDAMHLVGTLQQMGFRTNQSAVQGDGQEVLSPYQPRIVENEVLKKNYESLVSRVCRTESVIQTLKMNLAAVQAERDLGQRKNYEASEKLALASDAYQTEIQNLTRELVKSRKECKEAQEVRNKCQDDVRRLKEALEISSTAKVEYSAAAEDLKYGKNKLVRRVAELKEELSREMGLRASLEESHNTLMTRVHEMEDIVEAERNEVKSLSSDCTALRREAAKWQDAEQKQQVLRAQQEEQLTAFFNENAKQKKIIEEMEEDKKCVKTEFGKMKVQYKGLNAQLEQMKKFTEEKHSTQGQLEHENKQLHEALRTAAEENAKLIANYETQLVAAKEKVTTSNQQQETVEILKQELIRESKEKAHFQQLCEKLQGELNEINGEHVSVERESKETIDELNHEIHDLKQKLKFLEEEKQQAFKEKETLLDEINQAVDSMTEERAKLQAETEVKQLELDTLQEAKFQLEEENARLLERMGQVEQTQNSQQQIEKTMSDILEQKNKLAYDKGKLQSRVEQLESQLQSLATTHTNSVQQRNTFNTLQGKYTKSQSDYNAANIKIQRLESQLKQLSAIGERKEQDFSMALQSRDEAIREVNKLRDVVESTDGREKQKIVNLERNLLESKEDSRKLASSLDGIIQSHNQLQQAMETLQTDLGKKDSQIAQLKNEKNLSQNSLRQMQTEIDTLQDRLVSMETLETTEITPLREALETCKSDNIKMANSLDGVMHSNRQLQVKLHKLEDELAKKTYQLEDTISARKNEQDTMKQEICSYEERMTALKQQLNKDRDKSLKKTNKEVVEVKRQLDELCSKNGDLSRANTELRHKITELEYLIRNDKERINKQKAQLEHLNKVRKQQEDSLKTYKSLSNEIDELERAKQEYIKKNEDQVGHISIFRIYQEE
ncbi:unnamed protein product [Owenia fusiformis]|uniref:Uncharacterized protein n=1 Tax=Owenia fusiformis TaxID=6347 RepID=A0A8J1XZD9_OWEFU|nr:unnamed protein product [Owenia fusiformis]